MLNPSTVAPVRFSNGTPWGIHFNKNVLVVRDLTVHARFYWTITCMDTKQALQVGHIDAGPCPPPKKFGWGPQCIWYFGPTNNWPVHSLVLAL